MNIPVMRMQQAGRVLYLGRMTARDLLETCVTTEWDPAKGWDLEQQGYQRAPVPKHYMAIGKFLANEEHPLMPTAALLSARESQYGQLKFVEALGGDSYDFGHLVVPEGRLLYIVDYQHRWRGFRHAIDDLRANKLGDYVVPVVIMRDVPTYEEIMQFYLINSKQRRVDTDLALALLETLAQEASLEELYNLVGPGKRYRVRATRLTFRVAASTSGPWCGRIKQPHDLPQPGTVIKVKSFVDSLAPVLSKRASCWLLEDGALLDVLSDFWSALEAIVPASFADPSSQIQRTVGVYAFHIVFARFLYPRLRAKGDTSTNAFQSALMPAANDYINQGFWAARGPANVYVGSSGYRELARLIMDKLALRSSA